MKTIKLIALFIATSLLFINCNNEDKDESIYTLPSGKSIIYDLGSKDVAGISGTATFSENTDASVTILLEITGIPNDGIHPAHIHINTAAEGGSIALSLAPVDGNNGQSVTIIETLDDGTAITYDELLNFDGYINVHLSASNLGTIVAQGDIGQNDLQGVGTTYDLGEKAVAGISGNVKFSERLNGEVLAEIMLTGTPVGGEHPAHIHANTAVEGGGILLTFSPIIGDTGKSATNITSFDDGSAFTYSDITSLDSYINVHLSSSALGTIVAQGDIGQNDLTEVTTSYDLGEKAVADISGVVTFSERINGEALAQIILTGTPAGGEHPAHIHANTAAEGGAILFSFAPVNGNTGISATNVAFFDDGSTFTYSDIEGLDSYINVHLSSDNLGTIVAQGDIGQNDLTGDSKSYTLDEKDAAGISGTATFYKRTNGTALAVLDIQNTPALGSHPAHIHENDAATGGAIAFTFNVVDGDTGISNTQVAVLDNGNPTTYDELLTYNGYINVHLSATQLSTIVAQGNIGSNE